MEPRLQEQSDLASVSPARHDLLRLRAQNLSVVNDRPSSGSVDEFLVFRLGAELFAVELHLLRSIHRPDGLATVPCTPSYVAGVLNVRGEIVVVLSAAALLGSAHASRTETGQVLLVEHPRACLGLLVDEVVGVRPLASAALEHHLPVQDFVRGVAEGHIAVLELDGMLAAERIEVLAGLDQP